jgi:hypothetical protein
MRKLISQQLFWLIIWIHLMVLSSNLFAQETLVQQGLLWKIEKPEILPSYLFGTIHSEDPRVNQLPPIVRSNFEQADSVVLELLMDIPTMLKSANAMFLPEGQTLEQLLGKSWFAKAVQALRAYQMTQTVVNKLKPWAVVATLNMPPQKTGEFLDLQLYREAMRRKIPTYGLEKVEEQLAIFENMSLADQLSLLKETLTNFDEIQATFEKLHDLYLKRDLTAMLEFSMEQIQQSTVQLETLFKAFYKRLIDDRNLKMAKRMEKRFQEGNAFVAIGALHLPGENGVLKLLEKQGYQVTAVY